MNIAILGATSHIAKGLTEHFIHRGMDDLFLFGRWREKIKSFLHANALESGRYDIITGYDDFLDGHYDAIINCVGVEVRNKQGLDFTRYFTVTEEFDNLCLEYLHINPACTYISFSSGAVYGNGFGTACHDDSCNRVPVNYITPEYYYSIARINAEAKHRAHYQFNIIDLRIFAYFSRHINLTDGYLITDILQAIKLNNTLTIEPTNIIRDYLGPSDMFQAVSKCLETRTLNTSLDINSLKPIDKTTILNHFVKKYNLKYEIQSKLDNTSATGVKMNYYSVSDRSRDIGYTPKYSSLDTIDHESALILGR